MKSLCVNAKPQTRRQLILLALVVLLVTPGCVRRRLTVRTNPPGALVYVDNQQIGTSPCSVDFTYYGTREIRMVKPGYETLTVNQPIPTPWYETPGIDFISENLVPLKIRDNRAVAFNLSPQRLVPTDELIGRGQQLRVQAQAPPAVIPAGLPQPVGPPPVVSPLPASLPTAPLTFSPPVVSPTVTQPPPAAGQPLLGQPVPGQPLVGQPIVGQPIPGPPPALPTTGF